ncbi:hypothetical protein KUTeg_019031 [Tegillarca granosa]|uniref:T-cell immunomodulatory protein n=1 Tax=Tegillarca granosa TaxID=220873 RepID=A0ABQ9EGI8_TEGGR|nr:hypothetical protein KUTeg_019031 [Tegillarca granosa]
MMTHLNHKLYVLFVICSFFSKLTISSLTDVTSKSLGVNSEGSIAAFGDFNADKHIDIFVLLENGRPTYLMFSMKQETGYHVTSNTECKMGGMVRIELEPWHCQSKAEDPYRIQDLIDISKQGGDCVTITGVLPGDYNGDNQMDILITCQSQGQTDISVSVYIYWGSQRNINVDKLVDQPMILDVNGDMIPDLFGEKSPGQRYFWIFGDSKTNYTEVPISNSSIPGGFLPLKQPQSSAFVDMNGDLNADLCVLSEINSKPQLEIWHRTTEEPNFVFFQNIPLMPEGMKMYGQASFVDLDGNGVIDMLIPVCKDELCTQSFISVMHKIGDKYQWALLPISFTSLDMIWGFFPNTKSPGINYNTNTLRMGDFNLDGYPDILTVIQNTTKGNMTQRAVMLYNVPCQGSQCGGFSRTFQISWRTSFHGIKEKGLLPAFYDYHENGILDVIVTTQTEDKNYKIHLWQHTFTEDACFLKVMVLSGLCYNNCPLNKEPYGVNQPGPVVKYNTLDNNGDPQTGTGIPTQEKKTKTKTFKSIIPNSQIVIIPYPINDPSSRLVLLTGAALLGTCGFIAGIVGILHWREKVEDKKEKLQEAHKFHFDAM